MSCTLSKILAFTLASLLLIGNASGFELGRSKVVRGAAGGLHALVARPARALLDGTGTTIQKIQEARQEARNVWITPQTRKKRRSALRRGWSKVPFKDKALSLMTAALVAGVVTWCTMPTPWSAGFPLVKPDSGIWPSEIRTSPYGSFRPLDGFRFHKAVDFSGLYSANPTVSEEKLSTNGKEPHRHADRVKFDGRVGLPLVGPTGGRVSFVGWENGYGKVVKVTQQGYYFGNRVGPLAAKISTKALGSWIKKHSPRALHWLGTGLGKLDWALDRHMTVDTRYAHLKEGSIAVKQGDRVKRGQIIATAGATGRVTGPHLHVDQTVNGKVSNPNVNNPWGVPTTFGVEIF